MHIATTHKGTDFDAFASLMAVTLIYPETVLILPKTVNPNVKAFLSIHKDVFEDLYTSDDIDPAKVERLIVVDTNNWSRLDRINKLSSKKDLEIFLWDHHVNVGDISATWKCQEEKGATITLMVRELKEKKVSLTPILSTLFLAGLYEDTGNLTFPSTTHEDAYAAAYLLENRADLTVINSFLRPAYGEKQKNILFEMLQSGSRVTINGFNISFSKIEIDGHVEALSVVVLMYRDILNVDAAFGIFVDKVKDKCMVIGRSNIDALNIGSIMRIMGGGGHPGAGSAVVKTSNPSAVEEWIKELIEGNQQASVKVSDLMSFPVLTVPSDTPMKKVADILRNKGCTGLPVVHDDKIIGVISRRDFRKIRSEAKLQAPVKAFMSTDVKTIEPWRTPMQAVRIMVKHDIGRLPVVEDGKILGIITRSDTMAYFYDLLPG
ncbi:MAG: CBS domain-containing protein [Desulfobacterales bacterium]|nr:CBS domain-containing protein [Desulfobacterales bacterium]MBF0397126.1 CBS domain-containing protein [Desulfobacterales bacterium]